MASEKILFDFSPLGEEIEQAILKRLLEVAWYDFIDNHIHVCVENQPRLTKFVSACLGNHVNTDTIMTTLLSPAMQPKHYEYMMLYNLMRVKSKYIRKVLKVANTNIYAYSRNPRQIMPYVMTHADMLIVLSFLAQTNFTIFDYQIFTRIKWH